jgi:O-antigen ligase
VVEITIVTALVSLLLKKAIIKEKLLTENSCVNIFLGLFILASIPSFINTEYMSLSLRAIFSKTLKFAMLFLITKEIINTKQKLSILLKVGMASCILIVIDGFIQYFVTRVDLLHHYPSFKANPDVATRDTAPTASFPFPNDFASWILMYIFPVGMYAFFSGRDIAKRIFSGIVFLGLSYSLILTKVRGAWTGFLLALGCLFFFRIKRLFAIVVLISLVSVVFINKPMRTNVISMTSISDRSTMWKNGWEIFRKHPVIGNGINTFFVNYAKARNDEYKDKKGSYAHNCYLQMAADVGVLGLFFFLVFVVSVVWKGFAALRKIKDQTYHSLVLGISLALTAFLLHSFVDTSLYSLPLAALFWMSAGVLLAIVKISETGTSVQ